MLLRQAPPAVWSLAHIYKPGPAQDQVLNTSHAKKLPPETFQLLVDAVTDYALYLLDPEGRIVTWNTGAERFKGIRRKRSSARIFPGSSPMRIGKPVCRRWHSNPGSRFEAEGWRIRKDGSHFWAHAIPDAIVAKMGRFYRCPSSGTYVQRSYLQVQEDWRFGRACASHG